MSGVAPLPDVVAAYAAAAAEQQDELVRALLRTKSRSGRDVLAALVSEGRAGAEELEELGRRYARGEAPGTRLDPRGVMDYARVVALQTADPADRAAALGLLRWVLEEHPGQVQPGDANLLLQLAIKARDFPLADRVAATLPVSGRVSKVAAADLANPWIRPDAGDEQRWLAALNTGLFGPDVVQAGLLPQGETPFDRLTTSGDHRVTDEHRITVVISCYNPDRHLLTAVRSVVEQTWQNFELFVVDDASPAPLPGVLEEVERMDPRVRVIRKAVNGGTYRARNTALRLATGDFFTCLDSDDWAHPQRLELGVRPMLADPTLVATRSMGVRATEEMEISRVGYAGRFKAASSLMVRTFPVVNRVGFFDPVRKAADNEYALRVEAAFDGKVVDVSNHALTILLADASSLSASDYSPGWRHPARSEYVESYSEWHRRVQWRTAPMFLLPHGPRPFPAPRRWERHPQDGPQGPPLDVVVVADWREGWVRGRTVDRLRDLVREGRRVGLVHLETLVDPPGRELPLARPVRDLVHAGDVERVYLDDDRRARLVVVADPRVGQFPPLVDVRLTVDDVALVRDPAAETAGEYARESVEVYVERLLGTRPRWTEDWPPAPAAEPPSPGPADATGEVVVTDGLTVSGDLVADGWPLRERADGERGARLWLVHAGGAEEDAARIRELADAWAVGEEPWEVAAERWLARATRTWAVAVGTTSRLCLVIAPGVHAEVGERRAVLRRGGDPVGTVLVWRAGESTPQAARPLSAR